MDEDEDAEEKQRRMEAKIAAENFGAVVGFAAGAALAMKEKRDEHAAREERKKQQYDETDSLGFHVYDYRPGSRCCTQSDYCCCNGKEG